MLKRWHYVSGLTLSIFIGFHLINQLISLAGPQSYMSLMEKFRNIYRFPPAEALLLAAALTQVVTGIRLLLIRRQKSMTEKLQYYSGLYLSFFLLVHVSAVLIGRLNHLATNFYYAATGLNYFPATLFFLPYYLLAVWSVAIHIASIHYLKTGSRNTSIVIGVSGLLAAVLIVMGFTHSFQWRDAPVEYQRFILQFFLWH